jgi:hypothetical protein
LPAATSIGFHDDPSRPPGAGGGTTARVAQPERVGPQAGVSKEKAHTRRRLNIGVKDSSPHGFLKNKNTLEKMKWASMAE